MRMSELHAEQDEQRQAQEWSDYLAFEEAERELHEQALKDSSTQH